MTQQLRPVRTSASLAAALLWLGLLLSACAAQSESATPAGGVQIENVRDAQITPLRIGSALLLDIRSDTGIGGADVRLDAGLEVRDIVLRLHVRGLEQLTFGAPDGTVVTVSVPSSAAVTALAAGVELPLLQSLHTADGSDTPITRGHPWWMETGIVSDDPALAPTIPLQNAHFEVTVPSAFLRADGRSFSLTWVDFFR